jgi:hypothetical protein
VVACQTYMIATERSSFYWAKMGASHWSYHTHRLWRRTSGLIGLVACRDWETEDQKAQNQPSDDYGGSRDARSYQTMIYPRRTQ